MAAMWKSRDVITVRNLLARCYLGISDDELRDRQDVKITLELATDAGRIAESDELENSLNYKPVVKAALALAEGDKWKTIERLAVRIARMCIDEFGVTEVCITVKKTGQLRFAESVEISVTRVAEPAPVSVSD